MVKGVSIKFSSYGETVPKLLELIKFENVLKKHESVVLKPSLTYDDSVSTNVEFVETVLKYCLQNKSPGAQIFLAEGVDGADTMEVFEKKGYKKLAEKYGLGLIDLNKTEVEEIQNDEFLRFEKIMYPKILLDSLVISLPSPNSLDGNYVGSLSGMVGAFPLKYYKGFLSKSKDKLSKYPFKYQVHDILKCKLPEFTIADTSEKGYILAGQPLEIDKQATKLFGIDWKEVDYLRIVDETISSVKDSEIKEEIL